ncbi:hypothetical protein Tco_0684836, partial [Tanacetum coccineum]
RMHGFNNMDESLRKEAECAKKIRVYLTYGKKEGHNILEIFRMHGFNNMDESLRKEAECAKKRRVYLTYGKKGHNSRTCP